MIYLLLYINKETVRQTMTTKVKIAVIVISVCLKCKNSNKIVFILKTENTFKRVLKMTSYYFKRILFLRIN